MQHEPPKRVYAFVDGQNAYRATTANGWQYDLHKFKQYLQDRYSVTRAFYFMGYIKKHKKLYADIRNAGFDLVLSETAIIGGKPKGNVDVNLTLSAARDIDDYDRAILVSADGDFSPLVKHWREMGKALHILSPATSDKTSHLLKKHAGDDISYMSDIRAKIELK